MISHIVSTFSGKQIFGQDGPDIGIFPYLCHATHYMRERNIILYCTRATLLFVGLMFIHWFNNSPVINNIELHNPQETNALFCSSELSMLVGSSETVRVFSTSQSSQEIKDLKILQWTAGVIDGDGYFGVSKKGYCSLEIVMETRDIACLYKIKNRYGGSIKPTSHAAAIRYRLHHRAGIIAVLNDLNGLLYNPIRIAQFQKILTLYNIEYTPSMTLEYNSRYLAGLFDSDGSIYFNISSQQVFITISHKSRELLDKITQVYGGTIYSSSANKTGFKWSVSRKADILDLIDNYFHWNGCVSAKNQRFGMTKEFYRLSSLGATKATLDSPLGKSMLRFKEKWDKYDSSIID